MNTKKFPKKQKIYILHPPGIEPGASAFSFMGSADFTTKPLWKVLGVKVDKELQENVQSADLSKAIVQISAILAYKSYCWNRPTFKQKGATQISIGSIPIKSSRGKQRFK